MNTPNPITCDAARDSLHRSCDDELPIAERALLADHIAACSACRAFSEQLASIVGAMHRLRAASDPIARDSAYPRRPASTPTLKLRWPRIAAYIGGIAAVIAILISALNSPPLYPPPPNASPLDPARRSDIATAPGAAHPNPPPAQGGAGGGSSSPVLNVALASARGPSISLTGESAARLLAVELQTTQPDVRIIALFEKVAPPPPADHPNDGARSNTRVEPRIAATHAQAWRFHDETQ